jgi:hypothetical protein
MVQLADRDFDLIARTILGEAANEPLEGRAGVAHVILNRLRAGNYGKSIPDVLFAPRQFEPWNTRKNELLAIPTTSPKYQEALDIAKTVGRGMAPDPTGGALNFLNRAVSASRGDSAMKPGGWGHNLANPIQIGRHTFGTAAGAGTGREGRVRVASTDPSFVPTQNTPATESSAMPIRSGIGSLGGLGGLPPPPQGDFDMGAVLQALGMSLLSSPSNNPFEKLPSVMTAQATQKASTADKSLARQIQERELGLRAEDLEQRRAQHAINEAQEERRIKLQEQNAERTGHSTAYNTTRALYKDLDPRSPEFLAKMKEVAQVGGAGATYGTTPHYEVRDGKTYAVRYGSQGDRIETEIKGTVNKGEDKVDAGTHWIMRDKVTGQERVVAKNIAEKEAQEVVGKAEGQAIVDAPKRLENIGKALAELKAVEEHPDREATTGWQANLGLDKWAGTPQQGFASRVDQVRAGAFLEGAQALKGLGQMTEVEGAKATDAINRMRIAQGDAEFLSALNDYRTALTDAQKKIEAAQRRRGSEVPSGPATPRADTAVPTGSRTSRGNVFRVLP